jgi:hypothetical protein
MKAYQWFYWTSNPQFWENEFSACPRGHKAVCPPCEISLGGPVLKKKEKKLSRHFNFIPGYIDVVLSLSHWCLCLSYLSHWARIKRIPHIHLMCASYLDIHLEIDSEDRVRTKLYDKRGDFNFLFMCSNILAAPTHGVYISWSIRYFRAGISYNDILDRRLLLTWKLPTVLT